MHDPQPSKAAEYRRQAEEIRTMAQQVSATDLQNQLLSAARQLEVVAEEEERQAQKAAFLSEPKAEA